jgi:hypothetical protein
MASFTADVFEADVKCFEVRVLCFLSYRLASSLSCQQLASNLVTTIGFIH